MANLFPARVCRVPGSSLRPNPQLFSYPGLTAKPWHTRTDAAFAPVVETLESAAAEIRAEYLTLRASNLPSDYEPEQSDHGKGLHAGDWHWSSLIDRGERRKDMLARCPKTAKALLSLPRLCEGDMPFAFAFFSTLKPGSRIAPHYAPCNLRVRVHLPLIVPSSSSSSCAIKVAGETRQWTAGQCLIFDDSFEHETWNDSPEERVVLLLDLWHWELHDDEIEAIKAMFREVAARRDARSSADS